MRVGSSVSVNIGILLLQDCDTKTGINNRTMSNSPSKKNKQTNIIGFIKLCNKVKITSKPIEAN